VQFLTPEQLKSYRKMQEQQASMQQMGLEMAREMFGRAAAAWETEASETCSSWLTALRQC